MVYIKEFVMENNIDYSYRTNEKPLSKVMIDFVRNILETICPILKIGPFPKLLDKLFASKFARSAMGSYAMLLLL